MSEPIRGAEPHFTPEEFARLEPGDLVAAKSGSEYAILARDPHEASPTYAARWLGTSSPKIYARVDDPRCYAPTGPTKERLRPTPVEQGQTWRHRETRADWSLRRLEYDPFTDESHGTDWAHLVSTCCGAERKIAAKVLRRDYELVRTNPDHSAEAARQAFARGAEAALRDERRAEGESRLAADLARTAPEAVFRPGWWYYECATGEWWMVEGGGRLPATSSSSARSTSPPSPVDALTW